MNLANRLTMLRVVLAAAVFAALMADEPRWHGAAFAMFLVAIVTDWLDGWLARRTNSVSPFGKVADPIADKILVIGTLIALIRTRELEIPLWAVFLIVIRELIIGGVRVIAGAQGKVLAADRWGKIKTAVQLVAILLILAIVLLKDRALAQPWLLRCAYHLSVLCAVLALSSLGSYLRQYRAMLEQSWK
ncbi:MAG: CDP-diacylglycerol--glycerol-3-phosphate 3-phosphatidyltransferase [Elusimicrobia bacterium GWC2_65_9]|nr:MAG: CDP-diacylglycerol--glycerol-3-phosphate 3-phosphatidyltransferase [Elusimicrobia bacterium GWA2_66_18]OGR72891.1 MAG: CDP-diacylglycerol--glycerol-3-phosphate 3-phosphatidyltransferase [Elusimicrobia bacterium GWC2_65_9]